MSRFNNLPYLRKYDFSSAKVNDEVTGFNFGSWIYTSLGFNDGEVLAIHQSRVIIGWEDGSIEVFHAEDKESCVYYAPLGWVEDRPVYPMDVLYGKWEHSQPQGYKVVGKDDRGLLWEGVSGSIPRVLVPLPPNSPISTERALKQVLKLLEGIEGVEDWVQASIDDVTVMLKCIK